jgi:hypothetical protein
VLVSSELAASQCLDTNHAAEKEAGYMMLMPKELAKTLPAFYATENDKDPIVRIKFFLPGTGWTWYGIEYDGENIFYGYVVGMESELGYFTLRELEEIKGPLGWKVERDLYFKPQQLSVVKATHC